MDCKRGRGYTVLMAERSKGFGRQVIGLGGFDISIRVVSL